MPNIRLFFQNLSIALVNLLVVTPALAVFSLVAQLPFFLAKSLWIAVGVPFVYGIGNFFRMITGNKAVKAPIGLTQWLKHAALLSAMIFIPMAFVGLALGTLSTSVFLDLAGPLASGATVLVAADFFANLSAGLKSFSLSLGWSSDTKQTYAHHFKNGISGFTSKMLSAICPVFFKEKSENQSSETASEQSETSTPKRERETEAAYFDQPVFTWLYDSSTSSHHAEGYREWTASLKALVTENKRNSPAPK